MYGRASNRMNSTPTSWMHPPDAPAPWAVTSTFCPESDQQWAVPDTAAEACKRVCSLLRDVPLRCCRVDLVIRRAFITPDRMGLGITAYLTSCGGSDAEAAVALQAALAAFAGALCGHSTIE